MNAKELIRIHLELECVSIDAENLLARIPCANPDDIFRYYVAQHSGGYEAYSSRDLPKAIRERLAALEPEEAFSHPKKIKCMLLEDKPCESTHFGKSYIFPNTFGEEDYPDVARLAELNAIGRPVFAICIAGRIVSTCESSRENDVAAESWVQTDPSFRRRGYARQVTSAWAHDLQRQGKLRFYSHVMDNRASEALASSLNLIQYIRDAGYL